MDTIWVLLCKIATTDLTWRIFAAFLATSKYWQVLILSKESCNTYTKNGAFTFQSWQHCQSSICINLDLYTYLNEQVLFQDRQFLAIFRYFLGLKIAQVSL